MVKDCTTAGGTDGDPGPYRFRGILCLAGPPGSGKSAVGRLVSRALGLPFLDLDELVEQEAGRSIPEIFASGGEEAFRSLELRCLLRALDSGPHVLALGGGCLLSGDAMSAVLRKAVLVTLTAPDRVLRERCASGSRPLAASKADLAGLLALRRDHYASLPNRIDTGLLTLEEAALAVGDLLRSLRGRTGDPSP